MQARNHRGRTPLFWTGTKLSLAQVGSGGKGAIQQIAQQDQLPLPELPTSLCPTALPMGHCPLARAVPGRSCWLHTPGTLSMGLQPRAVWAKESRQLMVLGEI